MNAWAPARAMREAEDEEIKGFYAGMKPWQVVLQLKTKKIDNHGLICRGFVDRERKKMVCGHHSPASREWPSEGGMEKRHI